MWADKCVDSLGGGGGVMKALASPDAANLKRLPRFVARYLDSPKTVETATEVGPNRRP